MSWRVVFYQQRPYHRYGWEDAIVGPRSSLSRVADRWAFHRPLKFFPQRGQEARAIRCWQLVLARDPSCYSGVVFPHALKEIGS